MRGVRILLASSILVVSLLPLRSEAATSTCRNATEAAQSSKVSSPDQFLAKACALYAIGLEDDAVKLVKQAVEGNPNLEVPVDLKALLSMHQARNLVKQNRLDEARSILVAENRCSGNSPRDLAFLCNPFEEALWLHAQGLMDEAVKETKQTIQNYPSVALPKELRPLVGEEEELWQLRARYLPTILNAFEALGIIILLLLLAAALLGRLTWFRRWHHADSLPVLGRLFRKRIRINPFDTVDTNLSGPGLAALVESRFHELDAEGSGTALEIARGPDATIALPTNLPGMAGIAPQAQTVAAVLEWLFPKNLLTLSGYVHSFGIEHGAGITISLADREGIMSRGCTIWAEDDGLSIIAQGSGSRSGPETDSTEAKYIDLCHQAAAWAQNQLVDVLRLPSLGTRNWKSYAAFLNGVQREDIRRYPEALRHYEEALRIDRSNIPALFNYESLRIRFTDIDGTSVMNDLIRKIEDNRKKGDSRRSRSFYWEPLWYRAQYAVAVSYLHAYEDKGDSQALEEAIQKTLRLTLELEITLAAARTAQRRWRLARLTSDSSYYQRRYASYRQLRRFLSELEPSVFLLLASGLIQHARTADDVVTVPDKETVRRSPMSVSSWRYAPAALFRADLRKRASKWIRTNVRLLEDGKVKIGTISANPSRIVNELVAYVCSLDTIRSRADYNLACYYSTLGRLRNESGADSEAYDQCMKTLETAFEGGSYEERGLLLLWALKDPSLLSFRRDEYWSEKFQRIMNQYGGEAGVEVLKETGTLNDSEIQRLLSSKVLSLEQLARQVQDDETRVALTEATDISVQMLERAAAQGHLITRCQVHPSLVSLLGEIGVFSIDDVRRYKDDPEGLLSKLERRANNRDLPTLEEIKGIITRAQESNK
jgi:tetratricopeptide (TPR) repeat protein